jgi:sulfoxide reductase heme-binding subunit YedZ
VEPTGGNWPSAAGVWQQAAAVPARAAKTAHAVLAAHASVLGRQDLWYVSRASGLVLLVLFSTVVVLGIVARMGATPSGWPRFVFVELHRTLALFCVAFLVLHVVTAILDPFVSIGWAATVVPFTSGYRTLEIALGTLAVDFGGAVIITSLLRVRLGFRSWRIVHWLAYLAWPAAYVHTLTAGNDLAIWWVALIESLCGLAVLLAVAARIAFAALGAAVSGTPSPSGVPPEIPADFFSKQQADR